VPAPAFVLDEKPLEFAGRMPRDFVIFSEREVSVGRVAPNSRLDGADVHFDEIYMRKYLATYQRFMDQSNDVYSLSLLPPAIQSTCAAE
jgi:hypothetical protein